MRAIFVASLSFLISLSAYTQGTGTTGVIEGAVTSETGAPISSATVAVIDVTRGTIRVSNTSPNGRYRVSGLLPSTYSITVTLNEKGLAPSREVRIYAGDTIPVNFVTARISEIIDVNSASSPESLDIARPTSSTALDRRAITSLPVPGRRLQALVLLTPTAVADTERGETSLGGQRGINLAYYLDGVSYDNAFFGGSRGGERGPSIYTVSLEALDSIVVQNSGYGAEFGRSGGGVVTLTTRSGGNEFAGALFEYFRNGALTARDSFGNSSARYRQDQFGATFSGPLQRDVVHFFLAYDEQLHREPFMIRFGSASAGVPGFAGLDGTFVRTNNVATAFGRIDAAATNNQSVSLRINWARNTAANDIISEAVRSRTLANTGIETDQIQGLSIEHIAQLTASLLNELRVHGARETRPRRANSTESEINIAGFGITGQSDILPSDIADRRIELIDIVSRQSGRHALRAGIDVNLTRPRQPYFLRRNGGEYDFDSLQDYLTTITTGAQRWSSYRQGFGDPATDMSQREYAVFAEDAVQINALSTVTAGIRYEVQIQPQPDRPNPDLPGSNRIPTDYNNFGPRLGIARQVWNNRGVLRFNAGLFYSRTPAILLVAPFRQNGIAQQQLRFRPGDGGAPTFPDRLIAPPAGATVPRSDAFTFDPHFQNPRTAQIAASLDTIAASGIVVSTQLQYARMQYLERLRDINIGPPSGLAADGRTLFQNPRPNPLFARIVQAESTASGTFSAVSIGARKHVHVSHGFLVDAEFITQYTYARSRDDDSNERDANSTSYQDVTNLAAEYTWSNNDVRHNASVAANLSFNDGLTISLIGRARTGTPYSQSSQIDLNFDGNTNGTDRRYVAGKDTGRNAFRQPSFAAMDVRLTRKVASYRTATMSLGVDIYNVLNTKNRMVGPANSTFTGLSASSLNPNLGRPDTQLGDPRSAQLSVRATF